MTMKITIEINEASLKELVVDEIARRLGDIPVSKEDIKIEVKSKQNYKSVWETAAFRATYDKTVEK